MTDCDILASSLVLEGCLAKRKRAINRSFLKKLDMKQCHYFGTVSVKEDRENGKVVQKLCNSTVVASAALSRDNVAHTCHIIALVTLVLQFVTAWHGFSWLILFAYINKNMLLFGTRRESYPWLWCFYAQRNGRIGSCDKLAMVELKLFAKTWS